MDKMETGAPIEVLSAEDMEAIKATARDYVEGYFDGDEARMTRCLHAELVKRTIWHEPDSGNWRLGRPSTAEAMIGWARDGVGLGAPDRGRPIQITVEDVFRHIASVKVVSQPFMDYLHIAKIGDRWLIVNVLWELREGDMPPPPAAP